MNLEFKKYLKSVKTYSGADVNSDPNPLVMEFNNKRHKYHRKEKRIDIERLKNPLVRTQI